MWVVTSTLWGNHRKCLVGAIATARYRYRYSGWTYRFYFDLATVPGRGIEILRHLECGVVGKALERGQWEGTFRRFLPVSEDGTERFVSRDADSRPSLRGSAAAQEWADGGKLVHVIRDSGHQTHLMMAGLWGCIGGASTTWTP